MQAARMIVAVERFTVDVEVLTADGLVYGQSVRIGHADVDDVVIDSVLLALERTPPELVADIVDRGVVLLGELPDDLARRLHEQTGLPVEVRRWG